MDRPLEIFFSYAHEDEPLMNDVRRQLIVYERNGRILKWHDRMIPPGTDWHGTIDERLESAQIILLFMSPHFIESRYCYEVEGEVALRKMKAGQTRVLPIILRPCAWEATPFGELQGLPADAKPISRWTDRDEACLDAARGVMKVVDEMTKLGSMSRTSVLPKENSGSTTLRVATNLEIIYCSRCGHQAGKQSTCTGLYTHHEFVSGYQSDYCSRCGIRSGSQTTCTGLYTYHAFTHEVSTSVHCSRCGVLPGTQTTCTGLYAHHAFTGTSQT